MSTDGLSMSSAPLDAGTARSAASLSTEPVKAWQEKLLPLMMWTLVVLAAFFFLASFGQLVYLHNKIWEAPRIDARALHVSSEDGALTDAARFNALTALEANAMERRYHQANVLLMSRLWARYLGFVTGMILALVGAAFILGKLREEPTSIDASQAGASLSLRSSSPGLILAVLGVVLMALTIVTNETISTTDSPIYMQFAQPRASQGKPSLGGAADSARTPGNLGVHTP
jgi:hypothetical protein